MATDDRAARLAASIRASQAGRRRTNGGNNGLAAAQQAWAANRGASAEPEEGDWDKFWRPAGQVINTLSAGAYGTTGRISKQFDRLRTGVEDAAARGEKPDPLKMILETIGNYPGDFISSAGAALTGDTENMKSGSDAIESIADAIGTAKQDISYKNVQDNVNPVAKGVGGFALDIAGDPLIAVPGGVILGGVKGAGKGAVAAARATEGGNLAKTLAMPAGAIKEIPRGILDGMNKVEVGRAARAEQKANVKAMKANETGRADLGWITHEVQPTALTAAGKRAETVVEDIPAAVKVGNEVADAIPTPKPVPTPPPAAAAAVPAVSKAVQTAANKVAKDTQHATVTENRVTNALSDAAELDVRAKQANLMGDAIRGAAAAGPRSDDMLAALRSLSHDAPVYTAPIQREIRNLKPLAPKPVPADVALWNREVERLLGVDARKELRGVRDPAVFAERVDQISRQRIRKTFEGVSASNILRSKDGFTTAKGLDEEELRNLAKALGFARPPKAVAGETRVADFLRKKNVKKVYDNARHAEKATLGAFKASGVPGGQAIDELAKTLDADEMITAGKQDVLEAAGALPGGWAADFEDALKAIIPTDIQKYRHTVTSEKTGITYIADAAEFGDNVRAIPKYTFTQNSALSYMKRAIQLASSRAGAGATLGMERSAFLARYIEDAAEYLDLRLRSLGITPVTTALRTEGDILKNGTEVAFLGLSDVLQALPEGAIEPILAMGKNVNLPITMIHDMGRWALKSAEMEVDQAQKIINLSKIAQKHIDRMPDSAAVKFAQGTKGDRIVRGIATMFASPEVYTKLAEANIRNGAFANAVATARGARASVPVLKAIENAIKNPLASTGSQIDAILDAQKQLDSKIGGEGLSGTLAASVARHQLEQGTAALTDVGQIKQARAAARQDATMLDSSGKPLTEGAKESLKIKAAQSTEGANLPGNTERAVPGAPQTPARVAANERAVRESSTARTDEHTAINSEADGISDGIMKTVEDSYDDAADYAMDYDEVLANSLLGLPNWLRSAYKGAEKMSGSFMKGDLKPLEIARSMSARNLSNEYTKALNVLGKKYDVPTRLAAWNLIRSMDNNDDLARVLATADPQAAQAATELWPLMNLVFDHSNHGMLQRVGFDADYLNSYLRRSGIKPRYLMAPGTRSWESGTAWKEFQFLDGDDPFAVLGTYHHALQSASVTPDIAASFAAQFGNASTRYGDAMTPAEASAKGWKKANINTGREHGLFSFLDEDQYYPPEMLEQLAYMDRFLAASKTLDGDTFFDKAFRYIDPVVNMMKASITLWRPGHHVTNMMGEGLMNTLAGVANPKHYSDAMQIMRAAGQMDDGGIEAINKYIAKSAPEGFQLKTAVGNGMPLTIGGKTTMLDYGSAHKLLDRYGIVIHHNVAEDLLNETAEQLRPRTGVQAGLDKAQHIVGPQWLGKASAARDNVFRIAHANKLMTERSWRSVDEMMSHVAKEINSFHPNMQTLSAFEQKYVRRMIFFYTWQRQALSRIVESLIDTPSRVTAASKFVYNASVANGVDPQSFGEPMPNDPRIASYNAGNMTSVLWNGGLTPGQEPSEEDGSFLWGASINAPQLDILQSVFGGVQINPDRSGIDQFTDSASQLGEKAIAGNLAPWMRIPAELATGHRFGGAPINNTGEYLIDQTGLRTASVLLDQNRSDVPDTPELAEARAATTGLNWLTGAKFTNFTGYKQQARAAADRAEELQRMREAGLLEE